MFSVHDLLTRRLTEQTGFPVEVRRLKANPLTGKFSVEGLRIRNPESFPRPDLLVAPEVRGQAAPSSFLGREVRFRELSLHLGRLTGVRSRSGEINIAEFRKRLEAREEDATRGSRSGRRVKIEKLRLRLDMIEMADFATEATRREFPVSLEETFSDVGDPISLGPFFVEAFAKAGLSRAENPIFASFLPDLLWMEIRALLRPSLTHLIGPPELDD